MPNSESTPKSEPRMRKVLVPVGDQPDFPIAFPVRFSAEVAERLCIRENAIFVVDYVVQENPDDDRGVLRLNMFDKNGGPSLLTKICSPEVWPWQRVHALSFPQEAAAALLKEWDPMGPKVQRN
ncbi:MULTISPECIES: hypothetical protein [unclassified Mesorhizobium]|uniref:hypothetical protein n=1 Tax=unclassified Mesorhizobium TaxID=325217 RepID=UPI00112A30AC|nr:MULTISPECIES: hypothetical protein [unclassified Mesorhizobium]TPK89076.1 hypothetical protein FJ567_30720 [Mesorhizobium sp. B2-4-16]TPL57375.1 hypothetical protein FJ956_30170 [Mesorhizobium sp. B2-4-3]